MKVYFIRHGMTEGNRLKTYVGKRRDLPLCEQGIEMLKSSLPLKVPELAEPETVYVSPMRRAVETAQIYFPKAKLVPVEGFEEIDFGRFEGKNFIDTEDPDPEYIRWLDSDWQYPIPEGETLDEFFERCCRAFLKTVSMADPEKPLVIVAHGWVAMILLNRLEASHRPLISWRLGNGACHSFDWDGESITNAVSVKLT